MFKAVEILLSGIKFSLDTVDQLVLSSELCSSMKKATVFFNESSSGLFLSNDKNNHGEKLINVVFDDVEKIISFFQKY